MDQNTILRRADNVSFEVVAGEAILIDMQTGTYFSLNEVGTVFWESLDGEQTMSALADRLTNIYNDKTERFVADLKSLASTDAPGKNRLTELAHTYLVELDEVQAYLDRLRGPDRERTADELVTELTIDAPTVLGDIMELAETMLADKLLTAVN